MAGLTATGWLAVGTGLAFGLALVMLATFFATRNERWDRIAEWAFVAFAVMAVPTILATGTLLADAAQAGQVATAIGLVSVVVIGFGELASTLHVLDFRRIAPLITIAFLGFLAWIGIVSVLAITTGALPSGLGWLGVLAIVLGVGIVLWVTRTPGVLRGERDPDRGPMMAFFVPMIGIVAWLAWLGLSL